MGDAFESIGSIEFNPESVVQVPASPSAAPTLPAHRQARIEDRGHRTILMKTPLRISEGRKGTPSLALRRSVSSAIAVRSAPWVWFPDDILALGEKCHAPIAIHIRAKEATKGHEQDSKSFIRALREVSWLHVRIRHRPCTTPSPMMPKPPAQLEGASDKPGLHPRNPHRHRYVFDQLIASCPELGPFVRPNAYGDDSIDYADPGAVKTLNQALLKHTHGIAHWDLPAGLLLTQEACCQ